MMKKTPWVFFIYFRSMERLLGHCLGGKPPKIVDEKYFMARGIPIFFHDLWL